MSTVKIIDPKVKLEVSTPDAEKVIEKAARTCYKSETKITDESHKTFIKNIIKAGHTSVLEHASATFRIICDRAVTHELVRHRIASYSQESQRYVNYKNDVVFIKPSHITNEALDSALEMCNAITFDDPKDLSAEQRSISAWLKSLIIAENTYKELIALGWKPQEARSILPNCTKTEIVVTMNFRSWLNFLELRTSKAAHPDIRLIAELIGKELYKTAPTVFEEYK